MRFIMSFSSGLFESIQTQHRVADLIVKVVVPLDESWTWPPLEQSYLKTRKKWGVGIGRRENGMTGCDGTDAKSSENLGLMQEDSVGDDTD